MDCIAFKKGYKYQIVEEYTTNIPLKPTTDLNSPSGFITLTSAGQLTLKKGYAWDGPSGPTIDTLNFMRGSIVHDALYQLMREKLLDHEIDRDGADRLLQQMCKEDGMWALRAWWVYIGLKYFGNSASDPSNQKNVTTAPCS